MVYTKNNNHIKRKRKNKTIKTSKRNKKGGVSEEIEIPHNKTYVEKIPPSTEGLTPLSLLAPTTGAPSSRIPSSREAPTSLSLLAPTTAEALTSLSLLAPTTAESSKIPPSTETLTSLSLLAPRTGAASSRRPSSAKALASLGLPGGTSFANNINNAGNMLPMFEPLPVLVGLLGLVILLT